MSSEISPGILLIGNHAPPFGGVPNHIGSLAGYLAACGWRVHVLADVSAQRGVFSVGGYTVHAPTVQDKIVALMRAGGSGRRRLRDAIRSPWPHMTGDFARAELIRELVVKNDLNVISSYHVLKPGLSAAWVSEDLGLPLVTTIFGEIYARPEEHRSRKKHIEYIMLQSAVRLSCSQHCADSLKWLGVPLGADVLYYGVDVDRFRPSSSRPAGWDDRVTVAFVGRMVEEMGLGTLLDALPELLADERVQVVVAGADGPLRERALAAEAAHSGRVQVKSNVPESDLPAVYREADLVVAPSMNERACLGLAIVEAMASGVPVVGCRVGGTPEVVEDGVTGLLVEPGDPRALARAVLDYVDAPGLRMSHGTAGRNRAIERFNLRVTNERCRRVFAALI